MTTYVLIHGAADTAWYWHLLEAELRSRGHDVVAPDLPCDDDAVAGRCRADGHCRQRLRATVDELHDAPIPGHRRLHCGERASDRDGLP